MLMMQLITPEGGMPRTPRVAVRYTDNPELPVADYEPLFDLSTYRKVTKNYTSISSICELNNNFFATLTKTQQKELYDYFVEAKRLLGILSSADGVLNDVIRQLSDRTETIFFKLGIPEKLIEFVRKANIPFPEEKKQMRSHDTAQKTFNTEEYIEVTAISIMCKILCPILGESITMLRPPITDKENKEYHTFMIFQSVLTSPESRFYKIYNKLHYYLVDTIQTTMKKMNDNPNHAHSSLSFMMTGNGFCDARFVDLICAVIMTKKLVTFDIFKTEREGKTPNIMTYIYVVVFETAQSKISTIQSGTYTMPRFDPSDTGAQEDNTTQLENTARISKVSFDIPIMAETAIDISIETILQRYDISNSMFESADKFYGRNLISPSPLNRALIASLLGRDLGSAQLLLYLRIGYYQKLLIITQIVMLRRNWVHLACLMSSITSAMPRTDPITSVSTRIAANYNKTQEYLRCEKLFPGFSEKLIDTRSESGRRIQECEYISFDSQVQRLMNWIIDYDHFYNMPPALWRIVTVDENTERPPQGALIEQHEGIMRDVCSFLFMCHHKPEEV